MGKMRDVALAAVLAVLAGAGLCTALPMDMGFDEEFGPKEDAPYTVISDEGPYEVREYEPAAWACSVRDGKIKSKREMMMMFIRMIQYVNGDNSLDEEMEMTAPVTMYKEMSELAGVKKIEMCYYIPSKHQADPPKPTMKDVYIKRRGSMMVAVRSFKGMKRSMEAWEIEKLMLQEDLREAGVTNVNFQNCFGAMYYSPRKEEHVNEIWYELQE